MSSSGSNMWNKQKPNVPHILAGQTGVAGEVGDLRRDVANVLANMASIGVVEYTNPVAANAAGLEAATATTLAARTATNFLAAGKAALLAEGRNITITTAGGTPADAPATALVTGTDMDGKAQTETITVAQTAATASGVKIFKTVTSVAYATGDGTGATCSIGFGPLLGLPIPMKTRAGLAGLIREIAAGAVVTTGAVVAANRSYAPASAPNGSTSYAIYYEYDAAVVLDG